jgi:hypothetical protein
VIGMISKSSPTVRRTTSLAAAMMLGLVGLVATTQARADEVQSITIGKFTGQKTCTLYRESAGRAAVVATPYAVAAAVSWRTWLVKDCVENFATIRASVEAALAATGKFVIKPSGGQYVVSGVMSDVSGGGGTPDAPYPGANGYTIATNSMVVNMDVSLRDAKGRVIYGGVMTKRLETGSNNQFDDFYAKSSNTGQAAYGQLQHEVALAVARLIAFHISPLTVVSRDENTIVLNYGAPLLKLGTIVQVTSTDGRETIRYNVTSATANSAVAEIDSEGDVSRLMPGSFATVIEPEDPMANARRMKRVDLP